MILVGVDGSTPSRVALRWSMQRAAATGETVRLAHVVDDEWGVVSYRVLDEVRGEAEAILADEAEYARSIDSRVTVTTTLLEGNPMWNLISASAAADLVVVGTHKTGFVRGRIFGSRGLQLAAGSHAPAAVVPESPARSRHGIIVGVNESAASASAVRFAAEEAHRTGQELTIIGAWAAPAEAELGEAHQERSDFVKARIESVLMSARAQARDLHDELSIRVRQVNRAAAAEALVDASATATLLVIGSSRREAAPTTLGPVAHDVLINLTAPTVVVHAPESPQS